MVDLISEEAALGRWPRRLLHVPSLTSYEWQPGNIYGSVKEPEYNAITYTWGRWKLQDQPSPKRPDVAALPIAGITWSIPRVDPAHFTAHQLEQALKKTAGLQPLHAQWQARKRVDFVWLDVACIDQRASEPSSAAEIGRQAAIFRGAQNACVWYTTLEMVTMVRTMAAFMNLSETDDPSIAEDVVRFLSDPWFTSLWTLQEAFLRPNAFLLDKDGELLEWPPCTGIKGSPALLDVLDWGSRWSSMSTEEGLVDNSYSRAIQLIDQRGFKPLASFNAMATWEAALQRTSTVPEDRIYGIQQIFGFRLGKSSLDANPGRHYTLGELEDEFGLALMMEYPILSQFHGFTQPTPRDKRWRMNLSSTMPSGAGDYDNSLPALLGDDQPRCRFSVEHSATERRPVWWHGPTASLSELIEACARVARGGAVGDTFFAFLDVLEELPTSAEFQVPGGHFPEGQLQKRLQEWLIDHFRPGEVEVLLLGPSDGIHCSYKLGVLIRKYGDGEWFRIGMCLWDAMEMPMSDESSPELDFLAGEGRGWTQRVGVYGYLEAFSK